MRKFTLLLSISIASAIASSLFLIATPFFLGKAIDLMLVDMSRVVQILLQCIVLYVFYALSGFMTHYAAQKAGVVYTQQVRSQLITRLETVSLSYLDVSSHGYLLSVFTNDSQLFQDGLVQLITQGFQGIFTVVIAALFMLDIDVSLSLVIFISIPIAILSSYFINKHSSRGFALQQVLNAELNDLIHQYIENDEMITSNHYEEVLLQRFNIANNNLNQTAEKAQFMGALVNPTTRLVNNISYMLIGLLGSFIVLEKGISVGVLTSFISYSVMFSKPLNEFSSVFTDVSLGFIAKGRIDKLLRMPLQSDVSDDVKLKGETITMRDASFSYQDSLPAIQNLNLDIKPLSKVAIVGPTGSGKSTLINLLLRFYDLNDGEFKIDGHDVKDMSRQSVRSVMGVVMQEPWLFKGSIKDNLVYGNPHVSDEVLHQTCRDVGCLDFIESLDQGFNAVIGSVKLSQGQKQMLTIVRALISDAPVFLLDEATSNIDLVSENIIQKTLTEIMSKHTSFFVAHRLQTITNSDLILVMKEGRLIQQGTHQSLMAEKGFYYDLVCAQMDEN